MISTTEARGKSPIYQNVQSQWMYNALQHEIKYDITQSPIHPFQIKASTVATTTPLRCLMGVGL